MLVLIVLESASAVERTGSQPSPLHTLGSWQSAKFYIAAIWDSCWVGHMLLLVGESHQALSQEVTALGCLGNDPELSILQ